MTSGLKTVVSRLLILAGLLVMWEGGGAQEKAPENQVKAAFLYNFAKFVQWPQSALPDSDSTFAFGVIGNGAIAEALRQQTADKIVQDRKIVVTGSNRIEDLKSCQIVFIGLSKEAECTAALQSLNKTATLTVGDADGFVKDGGMIQFFIEDNRVRFRIKPSNIDRAGLEVSSKLLDVGIVVDDEGGAH